MQTKVACAISRNIVFQMLGTLCTQRVENNNDDALSESNVCSGVKIKVR